MTLKKKFVKTLETLLSDDNPKIKKGQGVPTEIIEESVNKKFKELHSTIYGLNARITILVDKINELNSQITNLTTVNEELLYTFDQGLGSQEDIEALMSVHFKTKKCELN